MRRIRDKQRGDRHEAMTFPNLEEDNPDYLYWDHDTTLRIEQLHTVVSVEALSTNISRPYSRP